MKKIIILLLAILSVFGCGVYSFYTISNPHIKSVMITEFENNSEEYDLPNLITQYLTNAFIEDNRLDVMGEDADMNISGTVRSYSRIVNAYDMQENPSEWKVTITFAIEAKDMIQDKVIWQNSNLTLHALYGAETETEEDKNGVELLSEEEAQISIIQELAGLILTNTLEQW